MCGAGARGAAAWLERGRVALTDPSHRRHGAVFEDYQKARTRFVQTVAELASRPQNVEALQAAGATLLPLAPGLRRDGAPGRSLTLPAVAAPASAQV